MLKTLYYVHDPMCSWCWAFRSSLNTLIEKLPREINIIRLLGGLAPDSDMPMPENIREYVLKNWSNKFAAFMSTLLGDAGYAGVRFKVIPTLLSLEFDLIIGTACPCESNRW